MIVILFSFVSVTDELTLQRRGKLYHFYTLLKPAFSNPVILYTFFRYM